MTSADASREAAVTLSAQLALTGAVLRLTYVVANHAGRAVYVSVRTLDGSEPTRRPYSVLRDDGPTVYLTYREAPTPSDIDLYAPILPLSRLLPAGGRHEDWLELEVPVEERHPHAQTAPPESRVVIAARVLFSTEYVFVEDAYHVTPGPPAEPGLSFVAGMPRTSLEVTLETSVPVRRRPDPFFRF
jgi:hypothetical protein